MGSSVILLKSNAVVSVKRCDVDEARVVKEVRSDFRRIRVTKQRHKVIVAKTAGMRGL